MILWMLTALMMSSLSTSRTMIMSHFSSSLLYTTEFQTECAFGTYIITAYTRIAIIPPLAHLNILVFKFAVSATSPLSYSFIMSFSLQQSAIPKTTSQVIHVLIVIFVVDFEPLCITMTPTGNTDARYSTSNYVQGNVYFVNNNIHGRKCY